MKTTTITVDLHLPPSRPCGARTRLAVIDLHGVVRFYDVECYAASGHLDRGILDCHAGRALLTEAGVEVAWEPGSSPVRFIWGRWMGGEHDDDCTPG